jgi:hypothetical protein
MRSHLVTLAPTNRAAAKRASELLSELDEWFAVSASTQGSPSDGFAAVEVGGHILDLEGAGQEVVARMDQIDPKWRESLTMVEPTEG